MDAPLFFFWGIGEKRLALSGGLKGFADRLGMGHPFYGFANIPFRGFGVDGAQPEHLVSAQFGGKHLGKTALGDLSGNGLIDAIQDGIGRRWIRHIAETISQLGDLRNKFSASSAMAQP